jgi:hypothetical protein
MDTAFARRSLLGLLLARLRRGVEHALDHLVAAAGGVFVAVSLLL